MNPPAGRVLLVKPSSFGDIIHALPVAAALAEAPGVTAVDWVTNPEFAGLLEGNGVVSRVVRFPRRDWSRLPAFARELRRDPYDVVIDLQGLLRSALISRGARSRRVVGMSDAREGASRFYDEIAPIREGHAVDRYAQVLDYLGVARGMPRFALPSAGVHPLPDLKAPYFVVHPFSRWPTKELPARLVSDIAVALHPAPVVVVGRGQWTGGEGVVDLTNATSLPSLLALLAGARGVVSSDSGPLHLAAALGVPLVAVFGPTSPGKTGPWTPNSRVLQLSLPCVPCASRVCRNAEPMACLEQISAARVVGALHECLAAVGGGP